MRKTGVLIVAEQPSVISMEQYREDRSTAEFNNGDQLDLRKGNERLLSPEAARALLFARNVYEQSNGPEKSPALLIAEYALACGVNLASVREDELTKAA
jgi:hypothetical protein